MILGKLVKQPVERRNYFIKYDDYLQVGETITSIAGTKAVVSDLPTGVIDDLVLIGPLVMPSGVEAEFWVEGGIDGINYKLEITATTSLGNIQQDEFKVKVKEI